MAQPIKNEADILALIDKMQVQLFAIDQKLNTLITRTGVKLPATPSVSIPQVTPRPQQHEQHKVRQMYTAICADCKEECNIPFKPSGDRPVYCQECFSRRKSGNMPVNNKPKEVLVPITVTAPIKEVIKAQAKTKKKVAVAKKSVVKKKAAPKKK